MSPFYILLAYAVKITKTSFKCQVKSLALQFLKISAIIGCCCNCLESQSMREDIFTKVESNTFCLAFEKHFNTCFIKIAQRWTYIKSPLFQIGTFDGSTGIIQVRIQEHFSQINFMWDFQTKYVCFFLMIISKELFIIILLRQNKVLENFIGNPFLICRQFDPI